MFHHAVKAAPHTLLFRTWEEGVALWRFILRAAPGPIALCLMPDHIHALYRTDCTRALQRAMRSYARWRNAHRGESGPVWQRLPPPTTPTGGLKQWRDEKYIHKNPCRAGLIDDPLAWPLSTYADAVGLTLSPIRKRVHDPSEYHRQTCRDDHITFRALPDGSGDPWGTASPAGVRDAVSALTRTPTPDMRRRGAPRTLTVAASRALTEASPLQIAADVGVSARQVYRTPPRHDAATSLIARVLGDARFGGLSRGSLLRDRRWLDYCRRRRIVR